MTGAALVLRQRVVAGEEMTGSGCRVTTAEKDDGGYSTGGRLVAGGTRRLRVENSGQFPFASPIFPSNFQSPYCILNDLRFKELHEAVNFYKTHALTVGFDVRHSTLVKARDKTMLDISSSFRPFRPEKL
ncbi:FAR1-related sequence 7 [Striga asiatica]|uniref:FAR1-related sequence 7 n=1 Tax=Striga asiatica TaxID=4170 RepID=A0A5A7PR12_STRAF|nr:FAR1-related sequence 7 [Striga asiatica]